MPAPLRRATLTDDVYETIQAMIMDHALAPGIRVSIDALARDLDVSPTPIREALARLESDGLVRKRPLVGYSTTPLLTRDEFEQLFDARLVLECAAAARAAERKPVLDLPDLPATTGSGYAGHAAFTAADACFHNAIAAASGNPLLHDAITRLHSHLHLHRLHFPGAIGTTQVEHAAIRVATESGDRDGAEEAMRAHLYAARTRHLAYWEGETARTTAGSGTGRR